jgi:Fur family transcriptional regulator, ferric uptake regulator
MPPTAHDAARRGAERIVRRCAAEGIRMTGQRRTIVQVLSEAEDHPDVEEVYRRAVASDPGIALSTVYRTLRLFAERGILERHVFGEGRGRYEQAPREHHDHLIDINTGRIIEFRDEDIEKIQEQVARKLGFRLVGHRLELFGVPLAKPKKQGK